MERFVRCRKRIEEVAGEAQQCPEYDQWMKSDQLKLQEAATAIRFHRSS
jgi:hypothetical protein